MRWIVDAQLPVALAEHLASRGHEAKHVEDVGLPHADDKAIWAWALRHDAIIISKDEDFVVRAHAMTPAPQVVWLRIGIATRRALFQWLLPSLPAIEPRLTAGERILEVR